MTTARAILPLAGPDGTFEKGTVITGVPDATLAVWVQHGAAEYIGDETADAPAPEAPAPPVETGTAEAPEKATTRPQRRKA